MVLLLWHLNNENLKLLFRFLLQKIIIAEVLKVREMYSFESGINKQALCNRVYVCIYLPICVYRHICRYMHAHIHVLHIMHFTVWFLYFHDFTIVFLNL